MRVRRPKRKGEEEEATSAGRHKRNESEVLLLKQGTMESQSEDEEEMMATADNGNHEFAEQIDDVGSKDGKEEPTERDVAAGNSTSGEGNIDDLKYVIDNILERNSDDVIPLLTSVDISSIQALVEKKELLRQPEIIGLKKLVAKQLFNFCEHLEAFEDANPGEAWKEHANEDWVDPRAAASSTKDPKMSFLLAKSILHESDCSEFKKLSSQDINAMYKHVVEIVTGALSKQLKDACNFNVEEFSLKWIRAIFNLPTGEPYGNVFVNPGKTQSGKTAIKAVIYAISLLLDIHVFIITKGLQESRELYEKIQTFLKSCDHKINPDLVRGDLLMVGIDTSAKIHKMIKKVEQMRRLNPRRKFIVINDECDALYRTLEGTQAMEKAHHALMNLGPSLRIEISATPMPTILILVMELGLNLEIMPIGQSDDYLGIEKMLPFQKEGEDVFIPDDSSELKKGIAYSCTSNGVDAWEQTNLCDDDDNQPIFKDEFSTFDWPTGKFPSCDHLETIPYTTQEMMDLYRSACESNQKKQGALVLDCTVPRVDSSGNIFEKACCVQNEMKARFDKDVVLIVNVGSGIYVRRPGFGKGRIVSNVRQLSEVLEALHKEFGKKIPFFVFGYFKMRRGLSCRCNQRVPTHVVLYLGKNHSMDNYVQSLGRGTFNGNSVLESNGYDSVTVLTTKADLEAARAYNEFLDQLYQKIDGGASPNDAIQGLAGKFSAKANFLRSTNRKLGQCNMRDLMDEGAVFQEEDDESNDISLVDDDGDEPFQGDDETKERYWNDKLAQGILRSFTYLFQEDKISKCEAKSIVDMFDSTYQETGEDKVSPAVVKKILEDYENKGVLRRFKQGRKVLWQVINWRQVEFMINKDLLSEDAAAAVSLDDD
mmetsp:Transcript_23197/g.64491  ORF Transcript_23197/g.64491 Transcript_23197/m.64491 type:complete len:880 (+) Transcript_23197:70-2709(+)|eukprot:CAMPEP_0168729128 /NCGR_PEP_ID=MMETSP0724-20121128/6037_1 /TAXON_ID=265536 /ORGANISM="Amphiprora sp., Strain CCMP467" /LENGTH=879 /DNA_ID=CAMNT_0008775989 /DNA_START=347 /DNA_END=2986 /DNA_ORIENTATION=+